MHQDTDIGYLFNQFIDNKKITHLPCVAVEETLSEKTISFLRRYDQYRNNLQFKNITVWDSALVRHIYDVHSITILQPTVVELAKLHFRELVEVEKTLFLNQKTFVEDPKYCLERALLVAGTDKKIRDEYNTRLLPLIYGKYKPDFNTTFKLCANALIESL
jgi:Nucleotidyl transferase AbiEii toxin, Type IV TA system